MWDAQTELLVAGCSQGHPGCHEHLTAESLHEITLNPFQINKHFKEAYLIILSTL